MPGGKAKDVPAIESHQEIDPAVTKTALPVKDHYRVLRHALLSQEFMDTSHEFARPEEWLEVLKSRIGIAEVVQLQAEAVHQRQRETAGLAVVVTRLDVIERAARL